MRGFVMFGTGRFKMQSRYRLRSDKHRHYIPNITTHYILRYIFSFAIDNSITSTVQLYVPVPCYFQTGSFWMVYIMHAM